MTGWLLDTNILSELRRPRPNAKVVEFVASKPLDLLYVSIVTFAEIRFGIEMVADPPRRAELTDWLTHKLCPLFEQRALAVSEDVMFKWRLLVEDGRKSGHTYSQPDLIIAATALLHGLTVVTRDTSDFKKARVPVLDPWHETEAGVSWRDNPTTSLRYAQRPHPSRFAIHPLPHCGRGAVMSKTSKLPPRPHCGEGRRRPGEGRAERAYSAAAASTCLPVAMSYSSIISWHSVPGVKR